MKRLKTVDDVTRALGGLPKILELTGANSSQAWNWTRRNGQFPACYMAVITQALKRRGYTAPARLFSQKGLDNEAA